nr:C568 [uncultured bacterium]
MVAATASALGPHAPAGLAGEVCGCLAEAVFGWLEVLNDVE